MGSNQSISIFGAGPVGLTIACLSKCLNEQLDITVFEKRETTTRDHGLQIEKDSMNKLLELLQKASQEITDATKKAKVESLKELFTQWKGKVVRTNDIESTLSKKANELGIRILKGKQYEVTEQNIHALLDPTENPTLTAAQKEMQAIIKNSQVIIGAEGAHSPTRHAIMKNELIHNTTLSHLLEFKFQSRGKTERRSLKDSLYHASKAGGIDFETMGRSQEGLKPVTLHLSVDEETYNLFRQTKKVKVYAGNGNFEEKEITVGTFENSWKVEEIEHLYKDNPKVKKVLAIVDHYMKGLIAKKGSFEKSKISTIPLSIYCSKESVTNYKGKVIVLSGDAAAGVVFGRGVNKGFMEAALCAKAINSFFKSSNTKVPLTETPKEFNQYQTEQQNLFQKEKSRAEKIGGGINIGLTLLNATKPFSMMIDAVEHLRAVPKDGFMKKTAIKILNWLKVCGYAIIQYMRCVRYLFLDVALGIIKVTLYNPFFGEKGSVWKETKSVVKAIWKIAKTLFSSLIVPFWALFNTVKAHHFQKYIYSLSKIDDALDWAKMDNFSLEHKHKKKSEEIPKLLDQYKQAAHELKNEEKNKNSNQLQQARKKYIDAFTALATAKTELLEARLASQDMELHVAKCNLLLATDPELRVKAEKELEEIKSKKLQTINALKEYKNHHDVFQKAFPEKVNAEEAMTSAFDEVNKAANQLNKAHQELDNANASIAANWISYGSNVQLQAQTKAKSDIKVATQNLRNATKALKSHSPLFEKLSSLTNEKQQLLLQNV